MIALTCQPSQEVMDESRAPIETGQIVLQADRQPMPDVEALDRTRCVKVEDVLDLGGPVGRAEIPPSVFSRALATV
jgi:hypothetical protein